MSARKLSQEEIEQFQAFQRQQESEEGIILNDPKASGLYDAFLSGLTNDEAYKTRWLAEKRFPGLVEAGIDPTQFYFVDGEGDIAFLDPEDDMKAKKEFKEFGGYDAADYMDKLGPTGQFLLEVIPGTIGMTSGFLVAGFPGAIKGGVSGTALGGTVAYATRAGISNALGGPPLNVATAAKDLTVESALGGLPFGVPSKSVPKAFQGIYEKFPGIEGREALQDVILNGGKTVDDKLAYLADKYPTITITRAEADEMVASKGAKLQAWLADQPENEKLLQFYYDRNARVNDIAENFFDEILTGKYVAKGSKDALFGKPFGDADVDVSAALDAYMAAEKKRLQKRVGPMYKQAYDLDVKIDIEDVLTDVRKVIDDPNVSKEKLAIYKRVERALLDGNTDKARSSTELIHQGLKDDFNRVLASLSGSNADAPLKQEITTIRNTISNRLKEANPTYRDVTEIYDTAKGTSQLLEKSIAGQFANVVEQGGTRAAAISKKLFTGNIKPAEITELKTILQQTDEGAAAWQNLKGTWLSTQWDDVIASQTNPLSEPNAYLRALGIKQPTKAFPMQKMRYDPLGNPLPASADEMARLADDVAEAQVRGKKAKMWQAILEPEELSAFMDLTDMLQAVGSIQTRAGSNTFSNFAIDEIVTAGSKVIVGSPRPRLATASKIGSVAESIVNIPSAVAARGFRLPGMQKAETLQKDAFVDFLISNIVDPKKNIILRESITDIKPKIYLLTQTFAKGGMEAVENLATTIKERDEALRLEEQNPSFGEFEQEEVKVDPNLQSSINTFQMPNVSQPLFDEPETDLGLEQLTSPTILPDEKDREIAMRQMGGIGSLV